MKRRIFCQGEGEREERRWEMVELVAIGFVFWTNTRVRVRVRVSEAKNNVFSKVSLMCGNDWLISELISMRNIA
jgi:hypothetical protein